MCDVGRMLTPRGTSARVGLANQQAAIAARQAEAQDRIAREQRAAEARRLAEIERGRGDISQAFGQFDDDWLRGREEAFASYYTPQVSRQFDDARRALIFALSDAGTLNSSVAGDRMARLESDYANRKVELANEARTYRQQVRGEVEGARGEALENLQRSGDAGQAVFQASQRAASFGAAPSFSPLGQVFQNAAAGIGAMREANDAAAVRARVDDWRRSSGGAGSGRVVRVG